MILGIGHDLAHVPRFLHLLTTRRPARIARLAQRILHPQHELGRFKAAPTPAAAALYLATAWACKEAVFKALAPGEQPQCRFNEWYKGKEQHGGPRVVPPVEYRDRNEGERIMVSVSHDGEYVSAFVVRCLQ